MEKLSLGLLKWLPFSFALRAPGETLAFDFKKNPTFCKTVKQHLRACPNCFLHLDPNLPIALALQTRCVFYFITATILMKLNLSLLKDPSLICSCTKLSRNTKLVGEPSHHASNGPG